MKLLVKILKETEDSTLSELHIDGVFECYILEDGYNKEKVYGETRIAHGVYPIEPRKAGKFYNKYKVRYNHNHSLWIRYVVNYGYVLIHIGNTVIDTHGCLLTGQKYNTDDEGDYRLTHSTVAYKKVYNKLTQAWQKKEKVVIAVDRSDSVFEEQEPINMKKVYDI
jgi:hypothetical protein